MNGTEPSSILPFGRGPFLEVRFCAPTVLAPELLLRALVDSPFTSDEPFLYDESEFESYRGVLVPIEAPDRVVSMNVRWDDPVFVRRRRRRFQARVVTPMRDYQRYFGRFFGMGGPEQARAGSEVLVDRLATIAEGCRVALEVRQAWIADESHLGLGPIDQGQSDDGTFVPPWMAAMLGVESPDPGSGRYVQVA